MPHTAETEINSKIPEIAVEMEMYFRRLPMRATAMLLPWHYMTIAGRQEVVLAGVKHFSGLHNLRSI